MMIVIFSFFCIASAIHTSSLDDKQCEIVLSHFIIPVYYSCSKKYIFVELNIHLRHIYLCWRKLSEGKISIKYQLIK